MLGQLADAMIENKAAHNLDTAYTLAKMLGLWARTKDEVKYKANIDIPQFWGYLKLQNEERRVVSPELYNLAKALAKSLVTHEFTCEIFKGDVIYQPVIIWEDGRFKSKLDLIKVDKKNKTLTPYDLKTTAFPIREFRNQFYKLRYYIQASMYMDAAREWAFKNYPGYELKPFQFIVVSRSNPKSPAIFATNELLYLSGKNGFYKEDGTLWRKGYIQLAEEYEWHIEKEEFSYDKDVYESNGVIQLT